MCQVQAQGRGIFEPTCQNQPDEDGSYSRMLFFFCCTLLSLKKNVSACNLLRQLKEKALKDGIQRITVARNTLWEDTDALFKSTRFDPSKSPWVNFEDEEGVVAGSLRREFFTLLMKAVINHPALLEGQDNKRAVIYSTSANLIIQQQVKLLSWVRKRLLQKKTSRPQEGEKENAEIRK